MPFLSGYNKRKAIKYGTVKPGSDLTAFPKLFSVITDSDIASEMTNNTGFAVTLADGTTTTPFGLYPGTDLNVGTLLMRAKFDPKTAATTGQVLGYIYYDHTATTTENKPSVMDGNYVLFMPLEEDPSGSSPQMLDWVTNSNIGTMAGTMTSGDLVVSQVGNGLDFDGSDDGITLSGSPFAPNSLTTFTAEILLKCSGSGSNEWTIGEGGVTSDQPIWGVVHQGSKTRMIYRDDSGNLMDFTGAVTVNDGAWHGAAMTRNGSSWQLYVDGATDGAVQTFSPGTTSLNQANLGRLQRFATTAGQWYTGILDEARISSVVRSADWLAYAYADDFTNSSTFTLGAEETGGGGGTAYTLSASVGAFTLTGKSATLLKSLHLANSPGSFTLTGKSATVSIGRPLSASAGSFVLTGQTATTSWPRSLSLSVGTFTVSGKSATFLTGKGLAGTPGVFTVTGQSMTFASARSLSLSRGTFTLSGQAATSSVGRPLSATPGAFLLTGKTLTASIARIMAAGVGSYIITGKSAQLAASNVILVSAIFRFDVQFARVQVHSPQFAYIQKFDVKFGGQ